MAGHKKWSEIRQPLDPEVAGRVAVLQSEVLGEMGLGAVDSRKDEMANDEAGAEGSDD